MKAFDLDPALRWLVCLTHPDDELAIAAWIARLTRAGAEVHLSWTHSNPIREAEARHAALRLGVPSERLRFFGATDGRVAEEMPALVAPFQNMVCEVEPDRVVCCAFEQGHLDHDATNYLVCRSYAGPVLEFPMYHTYLTRIQTVNRFADPSGEEVFRLTNDERRWKRDLARCYPSQRIYPILNGYRALLKLAGRDLLDTERVRLHRRGPFYDPNLPEPLASRVRSSVQWHRWLAAWSQVESGLRPLVDSPPLQSLAPSEA